MLIHNSITLFFFLPSRAWIGASDGFDCSILRWTCVFAT
jgi:hypothetical protein